MTWRKSSRSETGANCVEVRSDLGAVRDSKGDPTSPPLSIPVGGLVALVKSGRLNR